jgi:glutaredoxin-related protein
MIKMKVIMYGAEICPNCAEALEQLKEYGNIELDYRNITKKISTLKEFLYYRDHENIFAPIKEAGKVGIPFFILEDGTKTFEILDFIEATNTDTNSQAGACSLDGEGRC